MKICKKMHGVIFLNKNREESICNYIDYLRKNCGLKVSVHPKDSRIFHFFKSFFKYNIHESPYCIHIKSDLNAYEHCIERQYKIINKCKDGSFCGKCYAGVFEFIYPIEFSGEIFGFISVGGYQSENYNEYLKKISHKYTHKYSDLLESYKKLDNIIPDKHRIDTLLLPLCDMFSLLIYENLNKNVQTMEFDLQLHEFIKRMNDDDLLMVVADHGNDPIHHGTDHTREYVPLVIYHNNVKGGILPIGKTFANVGATIADNFNVEAPKIGTSLLDRIIK
jgi:hypothetical protein